MVSEVVGGSVAGVEHVCCQKLLPWWEMRGMGPDVDCFCDVELKLQPFFGPCPDDRAAGIVLKGVASVDAAHKALVLFTRVHMGCCAPPVLDNVPACERHSWGDMRHGYTKVLDTSCRQDSRVTLELRELVGLVNPVCREVGPKIVVCTVGRSFAKIVMDVALCTFIHLRWSSGVAGSAVFLVSSCLMSLVERPCSSMLILW